MVKKTFEDAQAQLTEAWETKLSRANGDQTRGEMILHFVLESERLRHEITEPGRGRDLVDAKTIAKLNNPGQLGPEHSMCEAVFRRAVENPASAFRYLKDADQAKRKAQSERASRPRPRSIDSITREIDKIIKDVTNLTAKKIGKKLEGHPDINIVGNEYRHSDGSTLKVAILPSRVSDAKKRVSGQPG